MNILIYLGIMHAPAAAVTLCGPAVSQIRSMTEVENYFFDVNIVGNPDREFAKNFGSHNDSTTAEVEKRYAASGDMLCGNRIEQAQLVVTGDVIITTAHSLYRENCGSPFKLSDCKFAVIEDGKRKFYDIASQEAGFKCSGQNQKEAKNTEDWAVLKLKKPVGKSVKPYGIIEPPCADEKNPADVVRVAKSNDFGGSPGQDLFNAPKHYGNCKIQRFTCGVTKLISSDCDASPGSSGGGTFIGGKNPLLVGLSTGFDDRCPTNAARNAGDFKYECWSSKDIAITGDVRAGILKAAGNQLPPIDVGPGSKDEGYKSKPRFQDL